MIRQATILNAGIKHAYVCEKKYLLLEVTFTCEAATIKPQISERQEVFP
jgi:hypothetical protein